MSPPTARGPEEGMFSFERPLYATLDLMPLDVRRKLDLAGLKISLEGWHALPPEARRALAEADDDAFATLLRETAAHTGVALAPVAVPSPPPWRAPAVPPALHARLAELEGDGALSDAAWAALTDGTRYVLLKLAEKTREDGRLRTALVELGLAEAEPGA